MNYSNQKFKQTKQDFAKIASAIYTDKGKGLYKFCNFNQQVISRETFAENYEKK